MQTFIKIWLSITSAIEGMFRRKEATKRAHDRLKDLDFYVNLLRSNPKEYQAQWNFAAGLTAKKFPSIVRAEAQDLLNVIAAAGQKAIQK